VIARRSKREMSLTFPMALCGNYSKSQSKILYLTMPINLHVVCPLTDCNKPPKPPSLPAPPRRPRHCTRASKSTPSLPTAFLLKLTWPTGTSNQAICLNPPLHLKLPILLLPPSQHSLVQKSPSTSCSTSCPFSSTVKSNVYFQSSTCNSASRQILTACHADGNASFDVDVSAATMPRPIALLVVRLSWLLIVQSGHWKGRNRLIVDDDNCDADKK